MFKRMSQWLRQLKTEIVALYIAARDPRTPPLAKAVALIVAAYALSPIDLIPDFIPVLGYLDDAILLPLGIRLALRLIPDALMAEFRQAARDINRPTAPRAVAAVIVGVWLAAAGALLWWILGP